VIALSAALFLSLQGAPGSQPGPEDIDLLPRPAAPDPEMVARQEELQRQLEKRRSMLQLHQLGGMLTLASLGQLSSSGHSLMIASAPPQVATMLNQSVLAGQPAVFTLNVTNGFGPFTFQWQFSGTNISGATNNSYLISPVMTVNAGMYTGIVSNAVGSASSSATLTVIAGGGAGYNRLSAVYLGGGTNLLNFLGATNLNYALERATNLGAPVWIPLMTNQAMADGRLLFTNFTTNSPVFYRTRYVP